MESLAAVYSEAAYGPGGQLPARQVAVATRSLGETEADLAREYSMFKRVVASYRLRSLVRRVRKGGSLGSER
jgi:hypothetical protein